MRRNEKAGSSSQIRTQLNYCTTQIIKDRSVAMAPWLTMKAISHQTQSQVPSRLHCASMAHMQSASFSLRIHTKNADVQTLQTGLRNHDYRHATTIDPSSHLITHFYNTHTALHLLDHRHFYRNTRPSALPVL